MQNLESDLNVAAVTSIRPKSIFSNATWNVLFIVWSTVVTFFVTPLLISRLGIDHYGLYVLVLTLSGFLGIMNLGLGEATLRYVAYYSARHDLAGVNRTVGASLSVYIVIACVVVLGMYFGSPFLVKFLAIGPHETSLGSQLLFLSALSFALNLVAGPFGSVPQALQRFDISNIVAIFASILQLCGTLVILFMGRGVYYLMVWVVVSTLVVAVVQLIVARHFIPNLKLLPHVSKAGIKEVFSYGIFALSSQVFYMVWGQVDRLLLGSLVSSAAVGYLTVPQNLTLRANSIIQSCDSVLFPRFSASMRVRETVALYLNSTWVLQGISIIMFVPLTILFPDVLRLWISPDFSIRSAWVGQLIAFSCIFKGYSEPYYALFRGVGKPQYVTAVSVIHAIASLALNVTLIPKYGLTGAGYAYLAAPVIDFLMVTFACRRVLMLGSLRTLIGPIGLPVLSSLILLGFLMWVRSILPEPGWAGLVACAILFAAFTAAVLAVIEQVFGGKDSRVKIVLEVVKSLTRVWRGRRAKKAVEIEQQTP